MGRGKQKQEFQPKPQKPLDDEFEPGEDGSHGSDAYWDYLATGDESLLQEARKAPNPVYPDSVGKDQDKPKPAWDDSKMLKEVEDLKKRLYDVEVKLNIKDAGGEKWSEEAVEQPDGVRAEIETLKKKIDQLSNKLGTENEPANSQWKTSGYKEARHRG